jgi:hypothetical protein
MNIESLIRLPDPRKDVRIEAREVVRDVFDKPHLFIRVQLTGWHFPHRAPEPFLVVGDAISRRVIIDRDGLVAHAYFDRPLPATQRVSFGYGIVIHWDFEVPIDPERIRRLERTRLPKGTVDPFQLR